MRVRHVRPLSASRIASLTTRRLIAYRRKLVALQESAGLSDLSAIGLAELDPSLIYFKDDPAWREMHELVKTELGGR